MLSSPSLQGLRGSRPLRQLFLQNQLLAKRAIFYWRRRQVHGPTRQRLHAGGRRLKPQSRSRQKSTGRMSGTRQIVSHEPSASGMPMKIQSEPAYIG